MNMITHNKAVDA